MLHVRTATDLRVLAGSLADVLSVAPADPMEPEWVAVPSAGMRTWLSLELSRRLGTSPDRADGISANIRFAFPGSLRTEVLVAERGHHAIDPWSVDRLVWPILDVATQPAPTDIGRLPSLLTDPPVGASRYSAARRVADLFDRYHLHRPEMVQTWARGHDVDGAGAKLDDLYRWQPQLWRAVRGAISQPSPPERLPGILDRLRTGDLDLDLPERVCVFGMSLLPGGAGFFDLARALGERRDVHLFVIGPASDLTVVPSDDAGRDADRVRSRRSRADIEDWPPLRHPLLRSWGRLHRETAVLIDDAGRAGVPVDRVPEPARPDSATLLHHLQTGIRGDVAPAGELDASPDDRSITLHACHGATRQVQVLRDQILGLLTADPHLDEDDVVVVCPDLEAFAPLIEAAFGPTAPVGLPLRGSDGTGRLQLRYQIADRSIGTSSSLVGAFTSLLDLVTGRFDAPAVLDFLSLDPVQFRHHLSEDDLATVAEWVAGTRARWGLDPEHRERHGLPVEITTNTWRASIDRLMVGATTLSGEVDVAVGDVVPYSTEGGDVAIAGRLANVLWRLGELSDRALDQRSLADWIDVLRVALDDFFAVPRDQQWQRDRLLRTLGEIVGSATDPDTGAVTDSPLSFTDVRRLVAERLGGISGRPAFFRGGITVTSLTPLRWVPHPVVCVLGMDAGSLGSATADGDDLTALEPMVGDRDRRAELRQSLLETVLSAERHLVIIRDGHDVRTNQNIPMPVALAELRDAVLAMATPGTRDDLAERLETHHPRQPFDEKYFDGTMPRSFDRPSLNGATSRRSRGSEPEWPEALVLPPQAIDEIHLADLHRFIRCPIQFFVERRLEMRLPGESDAVSGILDVKLSGLDGYAIGRRLLGLLAQVPDADEAEQIWRRREELMGAAPPGALGDRELDGFADEAAAMLALAARLGVTESGDDHPIDLVLSNGTRLTGSVRVGLEPSDDFDRRGPGTLAFTRPRSEHRLAAWLNLAALTASEPDEPWRAASVMRKPSNSAKHPKAIHLQLVDDPVASAQRVLDVVVDLYRRGLAQPLPLFRRISENLYAKPGNVVNWPRDGDDAELLMYGHLAVADLLALPVRADDPPGSADDRARRYAHRLFGTLAATAEDVT